MPRSLVGGVPVIAMLLLACGGGGGAAQPAVASVSLTASRTGPLASLGDTIQLTAVALDASGAAIPGVAVVFTSSNPAAATVTQSGLVTAIANGTTTIHAAAGAKEATLGVTVSQVMASVVVTPSAISVPPSETPLFRAAALDARGNVVAGAPAPAWTTSNSAIATVGATDGRATVSSTAASGSTVNAIATIGSLSSSGQMTIDPAATYVETIAVTASGSTSLSSLNQTLQLSATAWNPRQGYVTAKVTFGWSTSSATVASVSASGLATAVGNGSASISATANGVSGSLPVNVAQVVATVSVATANGAPAPTLASLGDTLQLAVTALDAGGSPVATASFAWSSDAAAVATVDGTGLVTAKGNGTAHVFAAATSNQVANPAPGFAVSVQQAVATVSVTPSSATIPRCTTTQYAAIAKDARGNPVGSPQTWNSSNTAIATVDGTGLARSVAIGGPVEIRATIGGVVGKALLTVDSSPIRVNWSSAIATLNVTTCAGQSIVWHNADTNDVHYATATGPSGLPNTGVIQPGTDSPAQTFPTAGSYTYRCLYHTHSGTVTVQ